MVEGVYLKYIGLRHTVYVNMYSVLIFECWLHSITVLLVCKFILNNISRNDLRLLREKHWANFLISKVISSTKLNTAKGNFPSAEAYTIRQKMGGKKSLWEVFNKMQTPLDNVCGPILRGW